jgi:hypoxanthine phosphoribosyltransferase
MTTGYGARFHAILSPMVCDHTRSGAILPPQPFISTEAIAARLTELGREIAAKLPPGTIHVVVVLRGAFVFAADLVRALPREVRCDFLAVRSYGSATETSGIVEITHDLGLPIAGEQVLLIEDIVDTGLTLRHLLELLATRHPASIHVCAMLNKPSRRRTEVPVDFVGFEIPEHFVVGYGLDHDQRYRNLPYIGVIEEPAKGAP